MNSELVTIRANLNRVLTEVGAMIAALDKYELSLEQQTPITAPVDVQVVETKPIPDPEPEELVINEEWKQVIDQLLNGTEHMFITGGAGTGKSTLLKHFERNFPGNMAIVAPTGAASIRVGGETIHRFFGFGAHALDEDDIPLIRSDKRAKFTSLDVLVIDEISMVRADLMDAIDMHLRKNRGKPEPFGGVRVIMFGDPFQLPPVSKSPVEKEWLTKRYGTPEPYFFHANVWRTNHLHRHELTTIFRQKDPIFTDALNAIRGGAAEEKHISLINSRVEPLFKAPNGQQWLTLTTTNDSADNINQRMLRTLNTEAKTFTADIIGDFNMKDAPADEILNLKVDATVMFVRNDPKGMWVNGTLGKVIAVSPIVKVEIDGNFVEVERVKWDQFTYESDEKTKKLTKVVKGQFLQIPLKLAAAITVHKSQGLTFDRCIVDFAGGAFAAGQAYVALSRCRTLEGMVLRRDVKHKDLMVSEEVKKFMRGEPIARPAPSAGMLL